MEIRLLYCQGSSTEPGDILFTPDGLGHVELDDCTNFDEDIARIARISTGSANKGPEADRKLIASLLRDDHGSPLEMGLIRFRLRMPLFVVMQLLRHRMASYSQKSGRYVEFKVECYNPGLNGWRAQGKGNKQVSGGALNWAKRPLVKFLYNRSVKMAVETYNQMLELGVAREQARIVLPQSLYTDLFAQFNLRSLLNLLRLRLAPDAQPEFQEYAKLMLDLVLLECPVTYRLLHTAIEVERRLQIQRKDIWKELMDAWKLEEQLQAQTE